MTEQEIRDIRKENQLLPVYKMVDTCAAEFESATPYFYSTYEFENESVRSEKESVLVFRFWADPHRSRCGIRLCNSTLGQSNSGCGL